MITGHTFDTDLIKSVFPSGPSCLYANQRRSDGRGPTPRPVKLEEVGKKECKFGEGTIMDGTGGTSKETTR